MRICANVPALRAMRSASYAEQRMEKISRRLSSGVRINSSKDDPAGRAIAGRLQTESNASKIASQSTINGISVVQSAEAALNEVHQMLQRMRELAIQSANDTIESSDRTKLQLELDQLRFEVDSLAGKTEYNHIKLVAGDIGFKATSDKANVASTKFYEGDYAIDVLTPATAAMWEGTGVTPPVPMPTGILNINGIQISINSTDTEQAIFHNIRSAAKAVGVTVNSSGGTLPITSLISDYYGSNNGIEITSNNPNLMTALGLEQSNYTPGTSATVAFSDGFDSYCATLTVDGNRVTITGASNQKMVIDLDSDTSAYIPTTVSGNLGINVNDQRMLVQSGPNSDNSIELVINQVDSFSLGVDRINIATRNGANNAISIVDSAIDKCSAARSLLGAYESRLEMTASNLETAELTIRNSLSKTFDTDMAYELAELSRNRIVSQSAMAVISQANQRPQSVLQLLRR